MVFIGFPQPLEAGTQSEFCATAPGRHVARAIVLLLVTAGNIRRSTEYEMAAAVWLPGRMAKFTSGIR
jgi:hypothetical protein